MSTELKEVADQGRKNAEGLATLTKNLDKLIEVVKKTPAQSHPNASQVFGSPFARTGESALTSRGFSFLKMLGLITQAVNRNDAKVEWGVHDRLTKSYSDTYNYGGAGITGINRFMAPLSTDFMVDGTIDPGFRHEMKSLVAAGIHGADPDHMKWIRQQQYKSMGYSTKALSWLSELTGGALVASAEQGELIELLRNKEALVNAGARVVPLPPQGRLKYPRQTSPSTTYWIGENTTIPESLVGTGEVTLQAKKLAVLIKAPNELIRFASPAAEALLRDDMTKSLALGLDLAGLEGLGGDTRPLGVINFQFINRINSSVPGVNGNKVTAIDIYRMIAAVEESNAEFESFIMRPKTLYKYYQLRADAVAQGDSSGAFLFNLIREAGDGVQATLAGYPVIKSTQVSQSRTVGTNTGCTYVVGGMFSDMLIGMFGALEFAATTMGDSSFSADQTWVRGILSADVQLRHPGAFVLLDGLDPTIV